MSYFIIEEVGIFNKDYIKDYNDRNNENKMKLNYIFVVLRLTYIIYYRINVTVNVEYYYRQQYYSY